MSPISCVFYLIGAGQVAAHGDARIIDQDSNAGVRAQHLFDPREIRLVGPGVAKVEILAK